MYKFEIKNKLLNEELVEYFNFYKAHLIKLYGVDEVESLYSNWYDNRKNGSDKRFFIKLFNNNEALGYAELQIRNDETLYFCDIVIKDNVRGSRLVLYFLKFVFQCKEFEKYKEIYLHINHKNSTSLNTWSHLGLEIVKEGKNSNQYKIKRKNIENYLQRFQKIT